MIDAARLIGFVNAERVRVQVRRQKTEGRLSCGLSRRLEAGLPAVELASLKEEGAGWTKAEAIELVERRLLRSPISR